MTKAENRSRGVRNGAVLLLPLVLLAQGEPSCTTYGSFKEVLQQSGAHYPVDGELLICAEIGPVSGR